MIQSSSGYLKDILAQPQSLRDTHAALEHDFNLKTQVERLKVGKYRRIVLTGMGSSHNVFYPTYYRFLQQSMPVTLMETSELLYYAAELISKDTLVIAASQSGQSAETVHLLDLAGEVGADVIGVTNTAGSALDLRPQIRLLTAAGEEATVSCKTYVCALQALNWLQEGLLGNDMTRVKAESALAADLVESYLEDWEKKVMFLMDKFHGVTNFYLTGRGPSLAAVMTGGLTTKEATHHTAEGMSAAALRHGPLEMMVANCFVMVFAGDPKTTALNRALAERLITSGARVGWVGEDAVDAAYRLPEASVYNRPILEILPVQMMTLAIAQMYDHVAGKFERSSKVTTIE